MLFLAMMLSWAMAKTKLRQRWIRYTSDIVVLGGNIYVSRCAAHTKVSRWNTKVLSVLCSNRVTKGYEEHLVKAIVMCSQKLV